MTAGNQVERMAVQKLACSYCGSKPGERCRYKSGKVASSVHQGRWMDARAQFFRRTEDGYVLRVEAV